MSEENTAAALAQIAFAEYYGRQAGAALSMPDSWDMQSDDTRADWEAAAVAVAAHVTTPTAEDFDHAAELLAAQAERDKAYRERAALVAYLSANYLSVMLADSAEPDWPIVFVSTPSGQMSWHIAATDTDLFQHVPATTEPTWDGHTTEQKYQRLRELTRTVATGLYGPQPTADL